MSLQYCFAFWLARMIALSALDEENYSGVHRRKGITIFENVQSSIFKCRPSLVSFCSISVFQLTVKVQEKGQPSERSQLISSDRRQTCWPLNRYPYKQSSVESILLQVSPAGPMVKTRSGMHSQWKRPWARPSRLWLTPVTVTRDQYCKNFFLLQLIRHRNSDKAF